VSGISILDVAAPPSANAARQEAVPGTAPAFGPFLADALESLSGGAEGAMRSQVLQLLGALPEGGAPVARCIEALQAVLVKHQGAGVEAQGVTKALALALERFRTTPAPALEGRTPADADEPPLEAVLTLAAAVFGPDMVEAALDEALQVQQEPAVDAGAAPVAPWAAEPAVAATPPQTSGEPPGLAPSAQATSDGGAAAVEPAFVTAPAAQEASAPGAYAPVEPEPSSAEPQVQAHPQADVAQPEAQEPDLPQVDSPQAETAAIPEPAGDSGEALAAVMLSSEDAARVEAARLVVDGEAGPRPAAGESEPPVVEDAVDTGAPVRSSPPETPGPPQEAAVHPEAPAAGPAVEKQAPQQDVLVETGEKVLRAVEAATGGGAGETEAAEAAQAVEDSAVRADQQRMIDRIARAISRAGDSGRTTVRLRLYPPELGTVRIEVSSLRGSVSARIETSTAEAGRALGANLGALRESIRSAGVDLRGVEVNHRNPSAHMGLQHQRRDGGGYRPQGRNPWAGGQPGQETGEAERFPERYSPGLLDVLM